MSSNGRARTEKSLLEAADAVPGILKNPAAIVRLISFGSSALEFDLLSWTDDPENQVHLQSEIVSEQLFL